MAERTIMVVLMQTRRIIENTYPAEKTRIGQLLVERIDANSGRRRDPMANRRLTNLVRNGPKRWVHAYLLVGRLHRKPKATSPGEGLVGSGASTKRSAYEQIETGVSLGVKVDKEMTPERGRGAAGVTLG
jgi:hypothetical protein